jgi:hypothetical protein
VATYTTAKWAPLAVYTDASLFKGGEEEGLGDEGRLVVTDHGGCRLVFLVARSDRQAGLG